MPVPVSSTAPWGNDNARPRCSMRSSNERWSRPVEVDSATMTVPSRVTCSRIPTGSSTSLAGTIAGPTAHEPSYVFGCGR